MADTLQNSVVSPIRVRMHRSRTLLEVIMVGSEKSNVYGPEQKMAPAIRAVVAGTSSGRNTYIAVCSEPVEIPSVKI